MARQPKDFRIAWASAEPSAPLGYLLTGPETAIPMRFRASITLETPPATVTIEVFVGADLRPRVHELAIRSNTQFQITTTVLRQVLVEQLLREAVAKAEVPVSALPPGAILGAPPQPEVAHGKAETDAQTAARVYSQAVTSGSPAPAMAVAREMGRSRAQVARYLRKARQMGLLPELAPPGVENDREEGQTHQ
ncbi:hypothetical protein [Actinokineospora iranica]|uniref:Uncharacterized protein n=1 Tax=Actinokineospora iranica TaxID=1271860 RepID=A0A1G6P202_9PSEU|nr:hypothetical protein [Actinokineospora iranica]SDC74028.1 hypothetical protein SAMN05216174_10472 [Actinokineospora iranica]